MIDLLQAFDSLITVFACLSDKATPTHVAYATVTHNAMPYLSTDLSLQIPPTLLQ